MRELRFGARVGGNKFGVEVDRRGLKDLERQVETLSVAVERRTGIGMALGIIMERLHLNDDQAFAYLSRCCQAQNRKLYELALEVVETSELPDAGSALGT